MGAGDHPIPIRLEPGQELTYAPSADFMGSDSLTFKTVSTDQLLAGLSAGQTLTEVAKDEQMGSNMATVTITVTAAQPAPVISGVTDLETEVNQPLTIELTPLVEGTFEEESPYAVFTLGYYLPHSIVQAPQHGTAELQTFDLEDWFEATRLVYTPEADFAGRDSLAFQAKTKDGKIVSNIATLWLTIYRPAVDQTVSTESGQAVEIALWDAASLKEGQSNGRVIKSQPQHGTLVAAPEDQTSPNVTYTPQAGFVGSDSFTFHLLNYPDQLVTNIATVTITVVAAAEEELLAVDQVVSTEQGQPVQ